MTHPSFSIIVPVYGVENYIEQCARSLFEQTYGSIQYVFVNDGTKDASIEILEKLIETDYPDLKDRVTIVHKENEGLPAARRTGLQYAEGDYVMHVDSDDWVEHDMVEKVAQEAERSSSDIICFRFFKEEARRTKVRGNRKYQIRERMTFVNDLFTHKAHGYVWNKCAKRSLYLENKIWFPPCGMHEDVYLMTQLVFYASSFAHIDAPLYHYRRTNPDSITAGKRRQRRMQSMTNMLDLYDRYKDDIENSPLRDMCGRIFYNAAWSSLRYGLDLLEKHPLIAEKVREIPVGRKNTIPIWKQLYARYMISRL